MLQIATYFTFFFHRASKMKHLIGYQNASRRARGGAREAEPRRASESKVEAQRREGGGGAAARGWQSHGAGAAVRARWRRSGVREAEPRRRRDGASVVEA
jgi:hypothetical protein